MKIFLNKLFYATKLYSKKVMQQTLASYPRSRPFMIDDLSVPYLTDIIYDPLHFQINWDIDLKLWVIIRS